METQNLSPRQRKILSFIESFIAEKGYPPTIREIGLEVGIASTSVVNYNLNKLVERGYIERAPEVSRGLRLMNHTVMPVPEIAVSYAEPTSLVPVPLVGKIAASQPVPLPGEDFGYNYDVDDIIEVPQSMIGTVHRGDLFALRVTGDSMIDRKSVV